ncbi:putative DNA-binding transcriptional regulator YafY [Pasteurella langaaensis DSM 22999]|uniref:Putative DNA-binding transcriptional regulator YafY n=1 Tax=Alitibacter langaaensis DSM 22999 TaxID=1122935 RepID=A0A2U0SQ52_9PAST|nr:WYL domain-containing protein [Pasteurella langaaensis]PVX33483.1 putative DNA-binding transcriptional regulator YafY [Pasteurella langaaensis DSM 22999]
MANRPKDIDATLLLLEILRMIPKLPESIEARKIHQKLADLGFKRDLRSIQRALQMLCQHFDDLECNDDSKPYTYYWKERSAGFALPILNEQQSLLLKLAEKQLKYLLPANIMSAMQPFFDQAERMVSGAYPNGKEKPAQQWLGKVCVTPTSLPLIPAKIKEEIFSAVSQALYLNKLLKVEYQNPKGKKHAATIMPLAIAQQGATIYLICRFDGFSDTRMLAMHRIRKAEISTFSFERPKDFNLQTYQEEGHLGFASYQNIRKIRLTFSISKWAGFHLTETPISKDQQLLEESDEHYRFRATVSENDMLEWWILKFGEDIWDIEREPLT